MPLSEQVQETVTFDPGQASWTCCCAFFIPTKLPLERWALTAEGLPDRCPKCGGIWNPEAEARLFRPYFETAEEVVAFMEGMA